MCAGDDQEDGGILKQCEEGGGARGCSPPSPPTSTSPPLSPTWASLADRLDILFKGKE